MSKFTFGIWGHLPTRENASLAMWRWDNGDKDFAGLTDWWTVVEAEDKMVGLSKAKELYKSGAPCAVPSATTEAVVIPSKPAPPVSKRKKETKETKEIKAA